MKSAFIVFILLFFGWASAHAKTAMTLYVFNHLGYRKQEQIIIEGPQKVFFNDIQIPKIFLPKLQKPLARLRKMPNEKRRFCYENQYNYTLLEGGNKQVVHACAEGKEFARIAGAFSEIQKVILKNGK